MAKTLNPLIPLNDGIENKAFFCLTLVHPTLISLFSFKIFVTQEYSKNFFGRSVRF